MYLTCLYFAPWSPFYYPGVVVGFKFCRMPSKGRHENWRDFSTLSPFSYVYGFISSVQRRTSMLIMLRKKKKRKFCSGMLHNLIISCKENWVHIHVLVLDISVHARCLRHLDVLILRVNLAVCQRTTLPYHIILFPRANETWFNLS